MIVIMSLLLRYTASFQFPYLYYFQYMYRIMC
jgi:hypothetical protein